jgi:hypothetical protein
MIIGIILLIGIFIIWKLFVDGLLFRILLVPAAWYGFICLFNYLGITGTAFRFGNNSLGQSISWGCVFATVICLGYLATSRD